MSKIPNKKKGRSKVKVKTSKAFRRRATWVKGFWRKPTKPFRIGTHKRNPRRTKQQIAQKGTRKQERSQKMHRPKRTIPKTVQRKF